MKLKISRIIAIVMVFAMLLASFSFASTNVYTVKSGDSLWKIATKNNTTWQKLAKINNLENPRLIFPNQKIKLKDENIEIISKVKVNKVNNVKKDTIVKKVEKEKAEIVIKNGNIYTENSKQEKAQALAIKDGKIIFVGNNNDVQKYIGENTIIKDLKGKTVIPSLMDSHTHPGMVGSSAGNKELAKYQLPRTSKEDMYNYLRKIAKENPDLPFLFVGQWSNKLYGVEGPDRKYIDDIFPNTVVILLDSSGHSYWLNTAAFKAFGIDEKTPDLKEGLSFFVKDKNGRKTGWVKEFALMPYMVGMPMDKEAVAKGTLEYLNFLAKKGVSSVLDCGNFTSEKAVYEVLSKLDKEGKLPVRYEATHHLFMPNQLENAVETVLEYRKKYGGNLLKFNTIKIHFDGVTEVNTAAVLEDFDNEPGNKGGMLFSKEELKNLLLEGAQHNIGVHLHSVGDRAVRTALDAMEEAQKEYGGALPNKLTLSHLEVVNPEDMKRFKELGVIANFTPHWFGGTVFQGGDVALGEERYSHHQPAQSLWDAGALVTFSSDTVSMPGMPRSNPYMGIQMGITRQEPVDGKDTYIHGQISDRMTIEEMIKGYTINNAIQLGIEKETGSIEVGKSADLVVLPKDIFKMDVYDIYKLEPEQVYFMGKSLDLKNK